MILIVAVIVLAFERKHHHTEFNHILGQLKDLVPPTNFPWLYSDAALAKVESEAKGDSIWIISPNLANVAETSEIIEAVKSNIKRRITYTYIVPDSNYINGEILRLQQVFSNSKYLTFKKIPDEQFRMLSVTHIAVFNASMKDGLPPEVFLELPIEGTKGRSIRGYWIRVARESATDLAERFRRVIIN